MNIPAKPSLINAMAQRYSMEPDTFYKTVRASIMTSAPNATTEQIAAFLMVAHEYRLSPILKQIHCYPTKSGGIVPIISIDGWCQLVNDQQQFDNCEFEDHIDQDGRIYAITCKMWRKDRSRPMAVTEYLEENRRNTDVWRTSPNRMLRHRAFIQSARLSFGLSAAFDEGHHIIDIDGTEVEIDMEPIRQQAAPPKRTPPPPPRQEDKPKQEKQPEKRAPDPASPAHDPETGEIFDAEQFLADLDTALASTKTKEDLMTVWADHEVQANLHDNKEALQRANDLLAWHDGRIQKNA